MKLKKLLVAASLSVSLLFSSVVPAIAAPVPDGMTDASTTQAAKNGAWEEWKETWETIKSDWTFMSLSPGSDATQLNFAWYSKGTVVPKLKFGTTKDLSDAKEYTPVQQEATNGGTVQYRSNKVTVTDLFENTTYYYSYQVNGIYTEPVKYTTKSFDKFRFIYVGDPQIGSSNKKKAAGIENTEDLNAFLKAQSDAVRNDSFNWNNTINEALKKAGGKASFIVSAGDQIQLTKKKSPDQGEWYSEIEYTGYLSPDALKSIPVATTVGNHDADNPNYNYHFHTPNNSDLGSNGIVGGDYYYTYGNTLFMVLNTQDTSTAEHKEFIETTIEANKECKWRIVTMHQDIYGSGEHSNEPEIANLRYSLVPIFEENDIDVVLTGHDHVYSRTLMLKGGKKDAKSWNGMDDDRFDAEFEKEIDADIPYVSKDPVFLKYLKSIMDANAVEDVSQYNHTVINPDGILYITANSSSGSKYYDLVSRQQTYIANRWQMDVPTYSIIDITEDTFTINTYRTDNGQKIDSTFQIKKAQKTTISSLKISSIENQTYTGKAQKPSVVVKDGSKTLKLGRDYSLSYKNNNKPGKATVTIKGKGYYKGAKAITFSIVKNKSK